MALKIIKLIVLQHNDLLIPGATHTRDMILEILLKEYDLVKVFFEVIARISIEFL